MSAPAAIGSEEHLAVLDGLIYADGFDCAPTLDELCRYSRRLVDREELARLLRDDVVLSRLVDERDGMYCLAGRSELLDERGARIERARRLRRRARRAAGVLRHVPFVRGLLLTGSVAADNARPDADADVLVIVAPRRLALVFVILGSVSRLLGRSLFCPNYYLCDGQLEVGPRTLYVAREIAQADALVGSTAPLLEANPWVRELLPAAADGDAAAAAHDAGPRRLQRLFEHPLRGRLGDRLERRARRLAGRRLEVHYAAAGERVPADAADALSTGRSLRFHRGRRDALALDRHARMRARLSQELAPK